MNKLVASQKKTIAIVILAVLVLSFITFRSDPGFIFKPKPVDFTKQKQAFQSQLAKNRQEYEAYLKSIHADPEQSKEIFQTLLSQEDVRKQVEAALDVNQKIEIPEIPKSKILATNSTSKTDVVDYFKNNFETTKRLNDSLLSTARNLYLPFTSASDIDQAIEKTQFFVSGLYATHVPAPALTYHASEIAAFESFNRQLNLAKAYVANPDLDPTGQIWPSAYKEYVIVNNHASKVINQIQTLDKQYGTVALLNDVQNTNSDQPFLARIGLVHEAQAIFGIGDFVFNFETGSIYEIINDAIGAVVGQFMSKFLNSFITKLEDSLKIVDFLYYNDALLAGRDIPDYLNKNIPDSIDQDIIKKLIPQYNCGVVNKEELKLLLKQKSDEYLGFDRNDDLDLSNPDVYKAVAKAGDLLSSEDGQLVWHQALKFVTVAEASKAVNQELLGEGKKASRSIGGKLIERSLSGIQSSQTAGLIASLALGTNNARNLVGQMVYTLMTVLINSFVFKSATVTYKEQDREGCLKGIPLLSALVPAEMPPDGPIKVDEDLIKRCQLDPRNCVDPTNVDNNLPPPPPVADSDEFRLDKTAYKVGETPKYQVSGVEPNSLIYFATDTSPRSTADAKLVWKSYEIDGELQQTDDKGSWPAAGTLPWSEGWNCTDLGTYTRLLKIGDKIYQRTYTVEASPSIPCE